MKHAGKAAAREEIRRRIAGMDATLRGQASARIEEHILGRSEWRSAQTVGLFLSLTDEPETRGLLEKAWGAGKKVALPKIDLQEGLTWWEVKGDPSPKSGTFWEPTPEKHTRVPLEEIQGFLVPGRAFDSRGGRLGRGGGHYDRSLSRRARGVWVVGMFFAAQEMEQLPQEPHDIPLPAVVTENGWKEIR